MLSPMESSPPLERHEEYWNSAPGAVTSTNTVTGGITGHDQPIEKPSQHQQTVQNPLMIHIAEVFPDYMCTAIVRNSDRASLSMAFPYTLGGVCELTLAIMPNKVQHIAMVLFGALIEVEFGARVLLLGNGARCLISLEAPLKGARLEGIKELLGMDVAEAIETNPTREDEFNAALRTTSCVSMAIHRNPEAGGLLNLYLGTAGSHEMKGKLFPRYRPGADMQ